MAKKPTKKTARKRTPAKKRAAPKRRAAATAGTTPRPHGRNLLVAQREFLVTCFAHVLTGPEVRQAWAAKWPKAEFPERSTLMRYRLPRVLEHKKYAALYEEEHRRFIAETAGLPFVDKEARIRALSAQAEDVEERILAVEEPRVEHTESSSGTTHKTVTPGRAELRKEHREIWEQLNKEIGGEQVRIEHTGIVGTTDTTGMTAAELRVYIENVRLELSREDSASAGGDAGAGTD